MSDDLKIKKQALRAEAKRARGLMSLNADGQKQLCDNFFNAVPLSKDMVIGAYWPKGRELDTHILMDECLDRGHVVALPVIEDDTRILKFARWHSGIDIEHGKYNIGQPVADTNTQWLEPDIFLVPMLAFDRRGYRLGFGGGYYDTTLHHYKDKKDILIVGLAYAQQACLFNLPAEEHDIKMDWLITEQDALSF